MAFQTNHPKVGGRKKGTPNLETKTLSEILDKNNFEPVNLILSNLPFVTPEKQIDVCLQLMSYLYPKRKALEIEAVQSNSQENPNKAKEQLEQLEQLKLMLREGV